MKDKLDRKQKGSTLSILLVSIGIGVLVASGAGVFFRGEPVTKAAVSIRGERYEYRDSGVYRYTAERVIAEGVGWDLVTLGLAAPAFFLTWVRFRSLFRKNNPPIHLRLLLAGILFYFLYQYLEYAMF